MGGGLMSIVRLGIILELLESVVNKINNKPNECIVVDDINLFNFNGNCMMCDKILLEDNNEYHVLNKCNQCKSYVHKKCYQNKINTILSELELIYDKLNLVSTYEEKEEKPIYISI